MRPANGRAVLLGAAIAAVLFVDLAVVGVRAARPPSGGAAAAAVRAALPELVAFVEQARGLRFRSPPEVVLLAGPAFEARLLDGGADEAGAPGPADAAFAGLLRALGLVRDESDLDDLDARSVRDVLGYYDPHDRVLYVRGTSVTPAVAGVIVHELVHALEDQHFGLDRPGLVDDAAIAFDALVEGSAGVVEQRWWDRRPAAEGEAADADEARRSRRGRSAGGGSLYEAMLEFPYTAGPAFVEALLSAGGRERLDAAFAFPPASTEEILHPERYLAGERPVPVPPPPADGPVAAEGDLGELGLLLVLDSAANRDVARRGAAGWAGDRWVAWVGDARTCVRWAIVMDTPADATELRAALRPWLSVHRQATVSPADPLVLTACT